MSKPATEMNLYYYDAVCKHCKWSSFLTSLLTQWPWTLWYRNWVVSFITLWNLRLFLTPSLPLLELKFMIYVRSITIIMNGILLGTYEVHIMNIFPICTTLFCASGCNLGSKPREKVIKEILELFHGFLFSYEVHQTHTSTSYRNTLRNSNLDTFRLNWIACEIVALFLLSELNLAIKENCEVKRICISQESFIESKKGRQHRMAWCYFCNIQPSHTKLKLIKGRFAFFVSSFAVPWRHMNNLPNRSRLSILLRWLPESVPCAQRPFGRFISHTFELSIVVSCFAALATRSTITEFIAKAHMHWT